MADDKEKFWDNLTKEYLTTEQKLNIIREHNQRLSDAEWNKTVGAIKEYLENKKDD